MNHYFKLAISMNICYTGIGAKKSQHTTKQFLSIMKTMKRDCSVFIKSLKCAACKKSKKLTEIFTKKSFKAQRNKKQLPAKILDKYFKEWEPLSEKCTKCKNKTRKQCNLQNYLKYSGAFVGKCKNV